MFTADMARASDGSQFDDELKALVADAWPAMTTYMKVWYGPNLSKRANEAADKLMQRGFKVTGIHDLDSFRFAEVHFSWGEDGE